MRGASYVPADQKIDPAVVAKLALDGLFAGEPETIAGGTCRAPGMRQVVRGKGYARPFA